MRFEIPKEHRDTQEAKNLVQADRMFAKALNASVKALRKGLHQSNPEEFAKITGREQGLIDNLKVAERAYDLALNEPKPIQLDHEVLDRISHEFTHFDKAKAEFIMATTMAHLRRNGFNDPRISDAILTLADGDISKLVTASEEARRDYRDVLLATNKAK